MTQSQGFSLFFGEWRVPLDISLLAVTDNGQALSVARPEFNFNFRYRSTTFSVRFRDEGAKARLDVSASLGCFPFSAESAMQRQALSAIVRGANKDVGPILTMAKGKIGLHTVLPLPVPVTAVGLISTLSHLLLPLKPYIDLMAMVRMMPEAKA